MPAQVMASWMGAFSQLWSHLCSFCTVSSWTRLEAADKTARFPFRIQILWAVQIPADNLLHCQYWPFIPFLVLFLLNGGYFKRSSLLSHHDSLVSLKPFSKKCCQQLFEDSHTLHQLHFPPYSYTSDPAECLSWEVMWGEQPGTETS